MKRRAPRAYPCKPRPDNEFSLYYNFSHLILLRLLRQTCRKVYLLEAAPLPTILTSSKRKKRRRATEVELLTAATEPALAVLSNPPKRRRLNEVERLQADHPTNQPGKKKDTRKPGRDAKIKIAEKLKQERKAKSQAVARIARVDVRAQVKEYQQLHAKRQHAATMVTKRVTNKVGRGKGGSDEAVTRIGMDIETARFQVNEVLCQCCYTPR